MDRMALRLLSLCFVIFYCATVVLSKSQTVTVDTCNPNVHYSALTIDCCAREVCQWQHPPDAPASHQRAWENIAFSWGCILGVVFAVLAALAIAEVYYVYLTVTNSLLSSPVDLRTPSATSLDRSPHQPQPRRLRITVQPQQTFLIGDSDCLVLSPLNSPGVELPAIWGPIPGPDSRGRAPAVVQNPGPHVYVHSNSGSGERQTQAVAVGHHLTTSHPNPQSDNSPDNNTRTQSPRAKRYISWIPIPRAFTAPYSAIRRLSRSSTLFATLTGLSSMQPVSVKILGVGLSWDHVPDRALPGPPHDMEWLKRLFFEHRYIWFECLLDRKATYDAIRGRMKRMYRDATTETYLIFYFAGHGTEDNAFELYDARSLNEVVLNEWIIEFRQEMSKHVPVYFIFDFCRESRVERKADLADDVHIIWACSPFQSALDLNLPLKRGGNDDLPRSCFLIALILAVDDASKDSALLPWQYFAMRIKELVMVVRGVRCYRSRCKPPWYCCRCETCLGGEDLCTHIKHSEERRLFQVVSMSTLKENPNFSAVVQFVANNFPMHIQRVTHRVANNQWFMFFNPGHIVANKGSIKPRYLPRKDTNTAARATVRHMTVPGGLDAL